MYLVTYIFCRNVFFANPLGYKINVTISKRFKMINIVTVRSGGVVEWLTRRTSNLRISGCIDSNPVRDKPLFP